MICNDFHVDAHLNCLHAAVSALLNEQAKGQGVSCLGIIGILENRRAQVPSATCIWLHAPSKVIQGEFGCHSPISLEIYRCLSNFPASLRRYCNLPLCTIRDHNCATDSIISCLYHVIVTLHVHFHLFLLHKFKGLSRMLDVQWLFLWKLIVPLPQKAKGGCHCGNLLDIWICSSEQ